MKKFHSVAAKRLEADGRENAAGSHEPRLSPLLPRRHLVDGKR